MTKISKNIKRARSRRSLTQDALAERIHVTRQTISGWETGRTQPSLDMLLLLCDALDVPAPDYYFLSGEELTSIVTEDDSQWIWGVLSGFEKSIPLEEILKYPFPEADGEGFWKNPPSIQHPLASIEIVPWDSSCVLLLSAEKEIVEIFKKAFSKCQDLSEYNS